MTRAALGCDVCLLKVCEIPGVCAGSATLLIACQGDFDVRWLRGSASDLIFAPWLSAIERDGGRVLGGKRVSTIRFKGAAADAAETVAYTVKSALSGGEGKEGGESDGEERNERGRQDSSNKDGAVDSSAGAVRVETTDGEIFEPDAVVLAVGITAAKVRPSFRIHRAHLDGFLHDAAAREWALEHAERSARGYPRRLNRFRRKRQWRRSLIKPSC